MKPIIRIFMPTLVSLLSFDGMSDPLDPLCPSQAILNQVAPLSAVPFQYPPDELILADQCPDDVRRTINATSCHTTVTECDPSESLIRCGKRALMNGDWNKAVQVFESAMTSSANPSQSCEIVYGRYLARLFRFHANWNNRFFNGFNHYHWPRAMYILSESSPENNVLEYYKQFACLTQKAYPTGILGNPKTPLLFAKEFAMNNLIDTDLDYIWEHQCTISGPSKDPDDLLPIRYIAGHCDDLSIDTVLVGKWDRVDAVLLYRNLWSSPAEIKRFILGTGNIQALLSPEKSSSLPCDHPICDENVYFYGETANTPDAQPIARLPEDTEWYLSKLYDAAEALFNVDGTPRNSPYPVHIWEDYDAYGPSNDGLSKEDRLYIRACSPETGEATFQYDDTTTAGAVWEYARYTPQPGDAPQERRYYVYCGPNSYTGHEQDCAQDAKWVYPGEIVDPNDAPIWLRDPSFRGSSYISIGTPEESISDGSRITPSPDFTKMAYAKITDNDPLRWDIFVSDIAQDPETPSAVICNGAIEDTPITSPCCITCPKVCDADNNCAVNPFPEGIKQASEGGKSIQVFPEWIAFKDPHNPQQTITGLLFLNNERPSSGGFQGGAWDSELYIATLPSNPDGTYTFSNLLKPYNLPSGIYNFHFHVSPDGTKIIWTSDWNPENNTIGPTTLMMATITYNPTTHHFSITNPHRAFYTHDHGWTETHAVWRGMDGKWRVTFTNSGHRYEGLRVFLGILDEHEKVASFYKLNWHDPRVDGDPFIIDDHPAWNEHAILLGNGSQFIWLTSDNTHKAAERYEYLMPFPNFFGNFYGTMVDFTTRIVSFNEDIGYLGTLYYAVGNLDGTNTTPLVPSYSNDNWTPVNESTSVSPYYINGTVYFAQKSKPFLDGGPYLTPKYRFMRLEFK